MKKLLLLSACAFLLINCTDTKNSGDKPTDKKDSTDQIAKKPGEEKKVEEKKPDVKDILNDVKPEDLTKQDKNGWPEDRRDEVKKMCMQDASDMPEKAATAYCNCQLDNLMKIFDSYKEAVELFNKTEEQLSADERKKAQMVMDTEESCWKQNMGDYDDEKEEMNPEESRSKKGNN